MDWARLSTGNSETVGIRTVKSQRSRSRRPRPLVSLPKTSAVAAGSRDAMWARPSRGLTTGWLSRPRTDAEAMTVR